jgi:uncharacterized membrane protein
MEKMLARSGRGLGFIEARRYRYFNVWRARARLLETDFYSPMIRKVKAFSWVGLS